MDTIAQLVGLLPQSMQAQALVAVGAVSAVVLIAKGVMAFAQDLSSTSLGRVQVESERAALASSRRSGDQELSLLDLRLEQNLERLIPLFESLHMFKQSYSAADFQRALEPYEGVLDEAREQATRLQVMAPRCYFYPHLARVLKDLREQQLRAEAGGIWIALRHLKFLPYTDARSYDESHRRAISAFHLAESLRGGGRYTCRCKDCLVVTPWESAVNRVTSAVGLVKNGGTARVEP